MKVPRATYRLQFHREFTFAQAEAILEYLAELGISDLYASPLFRAGAESTHGYDICCFEEINPALGDFDRFAAKVREQGLGLVLDMVPNHMGGALTNQWWVDVLRHGAHSKYAAYFDIDWHPPDPGLEGKVLIPVLEDHYGRVLAAGKLKLSKESGEHAIGYYDHRFPLAPETLKRLKSGVHEVLREQHYRLAWWRIGAQQINYRRFFDVAELVALRMERDEVFAATHRLLLAMVAAGQVTALRIDHPDGLWDPKQYFERLQKLGVWVVAEKILTGDEALPPDWPVAGTTGYDFLNRVNGLFIDGSSEAAFNEVYEQFTGSETDFETVVYAAKKRVLDLSFQSELTSLSHRLRTLAAATPMGQDLTLAMLRDVIEEVVLAFPVYRTYVSAAVSATDRRYIEQAIEVARQRNRRLDPVALEFLKAQLSQPGEFVMKFQQLTGPVMAKGLEDTAFYNYNRFISLNDVGGSPERFGISVEDFHRQNQRQFEHWPHTLLATATHDTKRGEDVRARLNVLSEIPQLWESAVWRWSRLNDDKKVLLEHGVAPHANDEYLLYQTLIGAWPQDAESPGGLKRFRERIAAYMIKALREAKRRTSWIDPNPDYEQATATFVERILNPISSKVFLADFKKLQAVVSHFGVFNSLAQTLLKLTAPGLPDCYQGTELWDLSLVDPDNRRPVDFALRRKLLQGLKREVNLPQLLANAASGEVKLFTIWQTLQARRERLELFQQGSYIPLSTSGAKAAHVCAFARRSEALVIVPRLPWTLCRGKPIAPLGAKIWQDTAVSIPSGKYRNPFTGTVHSARKGVPVAEVLNDFPVALWLRTG